MGNRKWGWTTAGVLLLAWGLCVRGADLPAATAATATTSAPAEPQTEAVPSFAYRFDEAMIGFKNNSGANRRLAVEQMESILRGTTDADRERPEWKDRADAYWALMTDGDPATAQRILESTLGADGTSPARAELLLAAALDPKGAMREKALEALANEVYHWRGSKYAPADIQGLESGLRELSFDPNTKIAIKARDLWRFLFPVTPDPMLPMRSRFGMLALIPGVFLLITLLMTARGYLRRKKLELEYASPGPAIEQSVSLAKGVAYLVALLGVGALLIDASVLRSRAVGVSAADLIQAISLLNVPAAALLIIVWSSNIVSGKKTEMRAMAAVCLVEAVMGTVIAVWMVFAAYNDQYLGGHPGPEIMLGAGGGMLVVFAGLLVAALMVVAARSVTEHRPA